MRNAHVHRKFLTYCKIILKYKNSITEMENHDQRERKKSNDEKKKRRKYIKLKIN